MDNKTNNNNKRPIQFTELTRDDTTTHEDLYINLLVSGTKESLDSHHGLYYTYAQKELQKAQDLFNKTFG